MSPAANKEIDDFFWKQVSAARKKYDQARMESRKALRELKRSPIPLPGGFDLIRRSILQKSAAQAEYNRILEAFNRLISLREIPEGF
jgi:hypothetical protein